MQLRASISKMNYKLIMLVNIFLACGELQSSFGFSVDPVSLGKRTLSDLSCPQNDIRFCENLGESDKTQCPWTFDYTCSNGYCACQKFEVCDPTNGQQISDCYDKCGDSSSFKSSFCTQNRECVCYNGEIACATKNDDGSSQCDDICKQKSLIGFGSFKAPDCGTTEKPNTCTCIPN